MRRPFCHLSGTRKCDGLRCFLTFCIACLIAGLIFGRYGGVLGCVIEVNGSARWTQSFYVSHYLRMNLLSSMSPSTRLLPPSLVSFQSLIISALRPPSFPPELDTHPTNPRTRPYSCIIVATSSENHVSWITLLAIKTHTRQIEENYLRRRVRTRGVRLSESGYRYGREEGFTYSRGWYDAGGCQFNRYFGCLCMRVAIMPNIVCCSWHCGQVGGMHCRCAQGFRRRWPTRWCIVLGGWPVSLV